jgi:transcriptional regulator with XRE-family HTH domain
MIEINSLAHKVKGLRLNRGLTKKQLSNKTGISVATISRIEKAKVTQYNPHVATVGYLASGLQVKASDLVSRESLAVVIAK